jgi:hypothetical protein
MVGYLRCTAARTRACSLALPFCATRASALRACARSWIGYRLPGRAKLDFFSRFRPRVVSLAMAELYRDRGSQGGIEQDQHHCEQQYRKQTEPWLGPEAHRLSIRRIRLIHASARSRMRCGPAAVMITMVEVIEWKSASSFMACPHTNRETRSSRSTAAPRSDQPTSAAIPRLWITHMAAPRSCNRTREPNAVVGASCTFRWSDASTRRTSEPRVPVLTFGRDLHLIGGAEQHALDLAVLEVKLDSRVDHDGS